MKMELERYITIYNETTTIIIKMKKKKELDEFSWFFGFIVLGKKITKRRQVEEKHGTNQSGTPI